MAKAKYIKDGITFNNIIVATPDSTGLTSIAGVSISTGPLTNRNNWQIDSNNNATRKNDAISVTSAVEIDWNEISWPEDTFDTPSKINTTADLIKAIKYSSLVATGVSAKSLLGVDFPTTTPNDKQILQYNSASKSLKWTSLSDIVSGGDGDTTYKLTLNGTTKGNGSTDLGNFYAPTSAGTLGQVLISEGDNKAPAWTNVSNLGGSGSISDLMGNKSIGSATEPIYWDGSSFKTANSYPSTANSTTLGLIKTGYETKNKNYRVLVDNDGNAYVTVPWESGSGSGGDVVAITDRSKIVEDITANSNKFITIIDNDFNDIASVCYGLEKDGKSNGFVNIPLARTETSNNTKISIAGISKVVESDVKLNTDILNIDVTENSRTYGVCTDTNGTLFVNIPLASKNTITPTGVNAYTIIGDLYKLDFELPIDIDISGYDLFWYGDYEKSKADNLDSSAFPLLYDNMLIVATPSGIHHNDIRTYLGYINIIDPSTGKFKPNSRSIFIVRGAPENHTYNDEFSASYRPKLMYNVNGNDTDNKCRIYMDPYGIAESGNILDYRNGIRTGDETTIVRYHSLRYDSLYASKFDDYNEYRSSFTLDDDAYYLIVIETFDNSLGEHEVGIRIRKFEKFSYTYLKSDVSSSYMINDNLVVSYSGLS